MNGATPSNSAPKPAAPARPVQEFQVVIPESNDKQRYSILQFNGPLNVDPAKWTGCELKMAREDNRAHAVGPAAIVQDYGEGSEYGRAAREEARRKRYGRQTRQYQHDRQPWRLTITDPSKEPADRRFRSVCEGGAGEHSDYWIFSKSGNTFQAHKIDGWYRFMPQARHKTLDIDQAEEQFSLRNKVLNQFALKAKIQQTLKDADEEALVSKPSALKIKDENSDSDEEAEEKEESKGVLDVDAEMPKPGKKGKKKGGKKDKRVRVENGEDVAKYESEDGEDEGREYDYMSDSGSDTSREEENLDEKLDKEMVAVGDESGMRDSSADEDEEDEKDDEKNDAKKQLIKKLKEQNQPKDEEDQEMRVVDQVEERDSSGSDSDDPDNPKSKTSVLFMQRKDRKRPAEDGNGTEAKRPKTASREQTPSATTGTSAEPSVAAAPAAQAPPPDRLDEETVRRLLLKKPHTTKELLNKIRPHCGDMNKTDIVARLADILRKIEPHQFRQTVNRKDVLFFSLKPPQ